MAETKLKKIESERAAFAYKCAEEGKKLVKGELEGYGEDSQYKSYVKKIPAMILANGLGQTIAFVKAKGKGKSESGSEKKNAYDLIYKQIQRWLENESCPVNQVYKSIEVKGGYEKDDLLAKIVFSKSNEYRALTREILAFMSWLGRLAEGLIEDEEAKD